MTFTLLQPLPDPEGLMHKTQSVTLIRNQLGYLWAETGKQYKTLRGAKIGITHDAKQLARRGVRVYTVLTIINNI